MEQGVTIAFRNWSSTALSVKLCPGMVMLRTNVGKYLGWYDIS